MTLGPFLTNSMDFMNKKKVILKGALFSGGSLKQEEEMHGGSKCAPV